MESRQTNNCCTICSSDRIKDKYYKNGFTITECLDCGSMFVKELLTDDELSTYYAKNTDEFIYTEENARFLSYYFLKLKKVINKLTITSKTKRILDVGCADGAFLDVMEDWDRYGNEISALQSDIASRKYPNKISNCSFNDCEYESNFFDVVTLQDSLDHFINPNKVLNKAYDILKQDGLIVVKVHNNKCLFAKLTKENFYAIMPPYHLQYYNTSSLVESLKEHNFKIEYVGYIPHLLQLKTCFYRMSKSENDFYYRMYKILDKIPCVGRIPVYKNFHDIVTVVARKI